MNKPGADGKETSRKGSPTSYSPTSAGPKEHGSRSSHEAPTTPSLGGDSNRRSLLKTLSWRVVAFTVTVLAVWVATGEFALAAGVGIVDSILKTGAYYLHERTWNRLSFGRHA